MVGRIRRFCPAISLIPATIRACFGGRDLGVMATETSRQSPSRARRLFPLYFSPIESLFIADDRRDYPMAFIVQLIFSGNVNRAAFESALPAALERHPFLIAHRQMAKQGLPCWVLADGTLPIVDWGQDGNPLDLPRGESIDLTKEVGLRIWIRQGPNRTAMTFQFHHSCCDGIGGYRFIGDLLALYGRQTGSDPSAYELSSLEPELLRNRKMRMTELAFRGQAWRLSKRCWAECFKIFRRKISPLSAPADALHDNDQTAYPGIVVSSFDRETYSRFTSAATQLEIGINDLLIAALFKTLHEWNIQNRSTTNTGWLRIMMPTDMREAEDFGMPAANIVSYTFLTRSTREVQDLSSLGAGICLETALIKNERRGLLFGDTLGGAMRHRWMLPWMVSGKRCLATAVLSNAGDPTKRFTAKLQRDKGRIVAGDLILEDIVGVPPLRIRTHVTIAIITYLRKLSICIRCCPRQFSLDDARRLSNMYSQSISELANE